MSNKFNIYPSISGDLGEDDDGCDDDDDDDDESVCTCHKRASEGIMKTSGWIATQVC